MELAIFGLLVWVILAEMKHGDELAKDSEYRSWKQENRFREEDGLDPLPLPKSLETWLARGGLK